MFSFTERKLPEITENTSLLITIYYTTADNPIKSAQKKNFQERP